MYRCGKQELADVIVWNNWKASYEKKKKAKEIVNAEKKLRVQVVEGPEV